MASQTAHKVVLIIGAGGYIGFNVAKAFSLAGFKVYGLVRSEIHVDRLQAEEIIPVIGSVESSEWVQTVAKETFDVVITATEDFVDPNTHTRHLLDRITSLSDQNKGKRLHAIYTAGIKDFGGSGLAGEEGFQIITEETPRNSLLPLGHRTKMIEDLFSSDTFDSTIITPSMVYGKSHSWYANWFNEAITSDTITIVGSFNTVWHGVHIDDLAQAYLSVVENAGPKVFKQNFLVSGDKYETVGDIVASINEALGGKHKIVTVASTPTIGHILATYSQWIDNSKLRAIGWVPRKPALTDKSATLQYVNSFRSALKDPFYKPQPTWDQINALFAMLMAQKGKQ